VVRSGLFRISLIGACLGIAMSGGPEALRLAAGFLSVFVWPGAAAIDALGVRPRDGAARILLVFGLSISLAGIAGTALAAISAFTPSVIVVVLAVVTVALSLVGFVRPRGRKHNRGDTRPSLSQASIAAIGLVAGGAILILAFAVDVRSGRNADRATSTALAARHVGGNLVIDVIAAGDAPLSGRVTVDNPRRTFAVSLAARRSRRFVVPSRGSNTVELVVRGSVVRRIRTAPVG
jgi:uncharacterized membrane protein YidH (DUF202 family)